MQACLVGHHAACPGAQITPEEALEVLKVSASKFLSGWNNASESSGRGCFAEVRASNTHCICQHAMVLQQVVGYRVSQLGQSEVSPPNLKQTALNPEPPRQVWQQPHRCSRCSGRPSASSPSATSWIAYWEEACTLVK